MRFMRRLGFKLALAVGGTALVTIGVFAYFNIRAHRASLLAEVERHANQLSELVKAATQYDMLLNQRQRLQRSISGLGRQQGIQRVRVLNDVGRVIYSSDEAELGKSVDKTAESCTKCHSAGRPLERLDTKERTRVFRQASGRVLGIINPIYNQPSCWTAACHVHSRAQVVLGVLDVTLPLDEVDKDIRGGAARIVVFALSAMAALVVIIGLVMRRWLDKPVAELVAATRHVAGGDLQYRLQETRDDELGMLARSFNHMTQKLSEARLQLFQSDKLASLGRLAAGVAHEINNPLTGVLTYSSYLLKRTEDRPEIQEDLKVIVRETLRSREIVKSLLDFARQSMPRKAEADLNEVIERAAAVVANQLALKKVRLVRNLDPAIPKAVVDANQLQQVFINLLVNASDAIGPEGGTITVSSAAKDGAIELKFADTGCGIPADKLSRIFEPFYTTKGQKGTGLGLSIVWGIVNNHNGTISVDSKVGSGTTFTIRMAVAS